MWGWKKEKVNWKTFFRQWYEWLWRQKTLHGSYELTKNLSWTLAGNPWNTLLCAMDGTGHPRVPWPRRCKTLVYYTPKHTSCMCLFFVRLFVFKCNIWSLKGKFYLKMNQKTRCPQYRRQDVEDKIVKLFPIRTAGVPTCAQLLVGNSIRRTEDLSQLLTSQLLISRPVCSTKCFLNILFLYTMFSQHNIFWTKCFPNILFSQPNGFST